ncbi:MAG: hypothetical protein JNK22_01835 [Rhodocyclaceae bacterium]|nr:hypothetical protein [Rhodocyclaceae bacterium]
MTDEDRERAVRRLVGVATLRRLRRMVDAEAGARRAEALWARRLAWAFAVMAALVVLALALR